MEKEIVRVEPIKIGTMKVKVGGSTLLMNKRSLNIEELLKSYQKNTRKPVDKKVYSDEELCEMKIHKIDEKTIGFPATAFKIGMTKSAYNDFGITGKGSIYVDGVEGDLVEIKSKPMKIHKTWGKIGGKRPIEIVRPLFLDWTAELIVRFNSEKYNTQNIIDLLNRAGFNYGIGDWRPEKGGSFGQYSVIGTVK